MSKDKSTCAHFFIDGPNIDATLGNCVLGHKPLPHERPRWERVRDVTQCHYGTGRPCFVLNGDTFDFQRTPFYRTLKCMKFEVQTPMACDWSDDGEQDPVDEFIKHELQELIPFVESGEVRGVLVASHDHGYASALRHILEAGGFVAVVGFKEWMAPALVELEGRGALLIDLEYDICAFDVSLGRPRFAA